MLTEICAELKNYFSMKDDKIFGDFTISDGEIAPSFDIQDGQYYRIVGSVFNDGVHRYGDETDALVDEDEFHGAIWRMRVPQAVIDLDADISAWVAAYGGVTSQNMSPYTSESFGGYSYSKGYGSRGDGSSGGGALTWQDMFAARLAPYRRIRL